MKRAIIVPDATRPLDLDRTVANCLSDDAEIIVGLGLHRRMTEAEIAPLARVCEGLPIFQSDPDRPIDLGEYDRITVCGVVEPHQYAGFSGGVKGIVIGCGSREQINHMHSLDMLRRCGARVGWVDGNPFQESLWEAAEPYVDRVEAFFEVPGTGEVVAGPVRAAFEDAVGIARRAHFRELDDPVTSMLLIVPPGKSRNFYQASRAATYVALAENPAIVSGGHLYLAADCPERIGAGSGEQACAEAMGRGTKALLKELHDESSPSRGGAQRAYVLAMALEHVNITLLGAPEMPELAAMGIGQGDFTPQVDLSVEDPFHRVPVRHNSA